MASIKRTDQRETVDERSPEPVVEERNAPTRYVHPHRDHGVEAPIHRPPSASQLAARAPPVAGGEGGVHGTLASAGFEGGDFVLRLSHATAASRALAQLLAAQGLEVEIVVRRRS